jgi:CheY-like chemotaxis protein/HPt (histidine-containing phosphotransfer) domain-containing protein
LKYLTAENLMQEQRLLLVEDSHVNQSIITVILSKAGYRTDVADNGREALQILTTQTYDLILMDLDMPEMDGFEATAAIRQLAEPTRSVPVIAVTANISPEARERARQVGMNDYLTKPVVPAALINMLQHWLNSTPLRTPLPYPETPGNLDTSILRQLEADTDPIALHRIIGLFIDETRNRLERITGACRIRDWRRIQYEAHALKSAAATLGAKQLHRHAQQLDEACNSGDRKRSLLLADSIASVALPALEALSSYADQHFKAK